MMKNPKHPGDILYRLFMMPCGITTNELAERISVSTATINNLIRGRTSLSMEMAYKLSRAFGNKVEFWLNLQRNYTLANEGTKIKKTTRAIKPFKRAKSSTTRVAV